MEVTSKSSYRFIIEILVIGILSSVGLIWMAPGPLFPMIMEDYSIDRVTVSLATAIVSLNMAIFAIPAGIIANRVGLKKTFAVGAFLMASGVLTPFSSNIIQLLTTRVIFAIGVAMTFPIAGGVVMQWFSRRELPLVNGLNMSVVGVGNTIALLATVGVANALGWKSSLALYGAVAFAFALAWLVLGKEHKSHTTESGAADVSPPISVGAALKQRTTLLLGLSMAGPFIITMAISSWLPTYYNEVFGMPLSQASSIAGLFTLFGIPACILGGLLPMWTGLRKPFLIIPGILLGPAALGTFLVNDLTIIYISVALFGICSLIFLPAIFTLAMELPGMSPQVAPVVIAAALAMGNFVAATGPLMVGFLTDISGSYLPGLIVCSVLSLTLFIGGLLLPETGPKAKRN